LVEILYILAKIVADISIMEKKYSDQIYLENLLLKRILNITIIPLEDDLPPKLLNGPIIFLREISKDLTENLASISSIPNVLDNIVMRLLGRSNWRGLNLLKKAYRKLNKEIDWSINANDTTKKFLTIIKSTVLNYFVSVLMNPGEFPNMLPLSDDEGLSLSAFRLSSILEERFPIELLKQANDVIIKKHGKKKFAELWEETLVRFFKSINNATIMGKAKTLADTFWNLVSDPRLVKVLLNLSHYPWIPGPGGINLKSGLGSCTGTNLEMDSPLGMLFKVSLFPANIDPKGNDGWDSMISHIKDDLHSSKNASVFDKSAKKYLKFQHQYANSLWSVIKQLLESKVTTAKEDTLRWLAATIVSNKNRVKLWNSLDLDSCEKISNFSSDALWYNTLLVLLELWNPFLKQGSDKLDKIDKTYLASDRKIGLNGETPIWAKSEEIKEEDMEEESAFADESSPGPKITYPKEYGTITEFYFMLAETVHYGLIPIIWFGEEMKEEQNGIIEDMENMGEMHPEYLEKMSEFESIQGNIMLIQMLLFNKQLIRKIKNFFKVQFYMIKKWAGFDEKNWRLTQNPTADILRKLPEHFITDMSEFYKHLFKHEKDPLGYFLPEDAISVFETAIILIRSPEAVTNPHIAAGFVEVLSTFAYFIKEKPDNWILCMEESEIIVQFLMEALVQFFVEIEFSGHSGSMYYEKFHYRLDWGSIFKSFWKIKTFKEKFCEMVGSEIMERFVNCLLNDTNHCLEEGLSMLGKIKAFEAKIKNGIDEEEKK
jgi:DNA-binding ferritin-like protein (Dps family)